MLEPKDRQPSKEESERAWMRAQVAQIPDLRQALDNLFQHIAVIARLSRFPKITPQRLVKEIGNRKANYEFLIACMQEETRINAAAQAEAQKNADQLQSLTLKDNVKSEETGQDTTGQTTEDQAPGND